MALTKRFTELVAPHTFALQGDSVTIDRLVKTAGMGKAAKVPITLRILWEDLNVHNQAYNIVVVLENMY